MNDKLIFLVNKGHPKWKIDISKLEENVYASDSTTIDLCSAGSHWAKFPKRGKGGVKIYALYDLEA